MLAGAYDGPLEARPEPAAEPLVLFAGRHIPEKRVPAIVPAIARARARLPALRAAILGDGPERAEVLRRVRECGLEDAVTVPGFVATETVDELMGRALCMLLPSRREGYGLVVIEAAARGTPSIVVPDPDNAAVELIEDGVNGVIAPSASPEDLAAAIVRVNDAGEPLGARPRPGSPRTRAAYPSSARSSRSCAATRTEARRAWPRPVRGTDVSRETPHPQVLAFGPPRRMGHQLDVRGEPVEAWDPAQGPIGQPQRPGHAGGGATGQRQRQHVHQPDLVDHKPMPAEQLARRASRRKGDRARASRGNTGPPGGRSPPDRTGGWAACRRRTCRPGTSTRRISSRLASGSSTCSSTPQLSTASNESSAKGSRRGSAVTRTRRCGIALERDDALLEVRPVVERRDVEARSPHADRRPGRSRTPSREPVRDVARGYARRSASYSRIWARNGG